ncbi:MAG: TrkH family potassium uptake protein [Clostridia bacterium]|nr:TrkH family potassium uptake protein [Clostridia bacterium]
MNYKMMGRLDALILAVEAVFMLPAFLISLFRGEQGAAQSFLVSMGIILAIAGILALLSRNAKRDFYAREGLICVGTSWLLMSLLGCLPLVFSGAVPNYIDALFEMVSGFTTTGSSIIPDLDVIPKGIIYWRSFSNWLGGMGVLVFLLAIVPVSGRSEGFTMHLLRAESPGPDVGKLVPRMRETAAVLYLSYLALSVINLIFLLVGGMPVFDAVCTMFSTAGTGGFGIYNDSFAGFSPYIQIVTTVFMLLFGINFSCYYLILLRKFRSVFRDEELRLYVGIVIASILLIAWNVYSLYGNLADTLRHSAFQVSSIITTTGFMTTDFDLWPTFSKAILLFLMAIGACAGSTGGGLKCARLLLLMKSLRRNVSQILRPKKVKVIRVNDKAIDERIIANTGAYFFVYVAIMVVSFFIVSLDGFSITTSFSAVLSALNNIGPGLDAAGPTCNFSEFGIASKLVLIVDMLAGRLEIFPILVLFLPHAWKRG